MTLTRCALLLSLLLPACDGGASDATQPAPTKAQSEAPAERAAEPASPPSFELPADAEGGAKALEGSFDADQGYDVDGNEHRSGLLWIAAKEDDPAKVAAALRKFSDFEEETYDPVPTKVAIGRLGDANLEVYEAAVEAVNNALWFDTVDPIALDALEGVLRSNKDVVHKVPAAAGVSAIQHDGAAFVRLLKAALAVKEPEVVAAALSKVNKRPKDEASATEALVAIRGRLDDPNPQLAAEAVGALARVAKSDDAQARSEVQARLESEHPIVRAYAVAAWAKMAGKDAGPALVKASADTEKVGDRLKLQYAEGGGYTIGRHQNVREVRDVVFSAAVTADPQEKWGRLDGSPESRAAFESKLKAWAQG